jgi:selenocysteine lyase/cysteine desulfurase
MEEIPDDYLTPGRRLIRVNGDMVEHSYSADSSEEGWSSTGVVYLNHAGQAPLTADVQRAGIEALKRPPWQIHADDDQKRVRELFASFIEADSSQIATMPSTAFAITLAARNIQRTLLKKKGRVLILQDQMCSAIYPWQEICEESDGDIELDVVPHPQTEGGWTEAILKRLDNDVLVACLPPLHWSDGALVDLEIISSVCIKHDIALIVDATQGEFIKYVGRYFYLSVLELTEV